MAKKTKAVKDTNSEVKEFNLIDDVIIDNSEADDMSASESVKTKRISHFDIIDKMFKDSAGFDNLTNSVLSQNFFMLNRTFSIMYPQQAQYFNVNGINGADVAKFWRYFLNLKEGYGRIPAFVYTKGAKKSSEEATKVRADKIDKQLMIDYCKHYHLSLKDFKDMLQFYNEETLADVERFAKIHSKSEQAKMFKTKKGSSDED